MENVPQRKQATRPSLNFEEKTSFPKNYFNCKQQGQFATYCPNLGSQGNPRTISQSANELYRPNETEA